MYEHDCDKCVLLAEGVQVPKRIGGPTTYDMYVCPGKEGPRFDALVARYGDKGEEYNSYHPTDMVMSAANGLLQGLWRDHYGVKSAGHGFVVLSNGDRVSFR